MGLTPRGRIALIGGLACIALLCWFVLARGSAGWPGMWGFGGDAAEWHAVWIAFWAGAFPTIATALVIAVAAGIYLNDRERRLDERDEERAAQRDYQERVAILRQRLDAAFDKSLNIGMHRGMTLGETIPPRARAVWAVMEAQAWHRWRSHLPKEETFFQLLADVEAAYRMCDRVAPLLQSALEMIIPQAKRRLRAQRSTERLMMGLLDELPPDAFVAYAIGRIIGQNSADAAGVLGQNARVAQVLEEVWGAAQTVDTMLTPSVAEYATTHCRLFKALGALGTHVTGRDLTNEPWAAIPAPGPPGP